MKDRPSQSERNRDILKNLSPKDILKTGLETERLEQISVNSLLLDEGIVDDKHCNELRISMDGRRGQLSAITVRARLDENGKIVHDVIDGFHRGNAKKIKAEMSGIDLKIDAKVLYGCSDEEMFDLRILSVNSMHSVAFARLGVWMHKSWEQTKWHKQNIILEQALAVTAADSSGKKLHLPENEIDEIKQWILNKAELWGRPAGAIYQDILAMRDAHPDLIRRVRIGGGGSHTKKGEINPAAFRAIVRELKNAKKLQLRVADTVYKSALDQEEAGQVSRLVARRKDNKEVVTTILNNPHKYIKKEKSEIVQRSARKHLFTSEKRAPENGGLHRTVERLRLEVRRLRQRLAESQAGLSTTGEDESRPIYEAIFESTPEERKLLKMFYLENKDPETIAFELHFLPNKVWQLIQSGHVKFLQSEREKKFRKLCQSIPKPQK